ncbi:hypothetical protein PPTG_12947 [Phytophthora nicotianae INRA-310]|uniref:Uncharacterized protein n=1 Tax=Phytophthora nicotianae (strain INRA-310) TaxID=761204 RepID=W2Q3Y6_PHYN3|nr:hypothetical protein PPTG_12947 [Phytophthora nicotianae INRA-310]ETN06975.1 hypothetical protein PPTG_12947 [Phytophthora nicotianae INRA-310]
MTIREEGTKDDAEDEEDAKAVKDAEEEEDAEEKVPATENQGKKRSISEVDYEELVGVPAFKKEHDSWASLEVSLREYMERTHQKIVIKDVIHTARRNATLSSSIQGPAVPLVPSELQPFQRKFICTHGWSERERSTGKRTSHTLRRAECPFQMLAQLTKKADGSWGVMMRREIYQHNYLISEDIYRYYPGIRQVSDDSPLLPGVEVLCLSKVLVNLTFKGWS